MSMLTIQLRLPLDLMRRLAERAIKRGVTMDELVAELLEKAVAEGDGDQ
jgi:predicted DNA binding CopG/RHH family protein